MIRPRKLFIFGLVVAAILAVPCYYIGEFFLLSWKYRAPNADDIIVPETIPISINIQDKDSKGKGKIMDGHSLYKRGYIDGWNQYLSQYLSSKDSLPSPGIAQASELSNLGLSKGYEDCRRKIAADKSH